MPEHQHPYLLPAVNRNEPQYASPDAAYPP